MAKVLQLKFQNEIGKTINLGLTYVNEQLRPEVVQEAMTQLANLKLFRDKDGNLIYDKPLSAKYVETKETPITSVSD